MQQQLSHVLVCVVGPTATGKTELAQLLAQQRSAAVLSADSMQIYTGMDIGTGKIPVTSRTVEYFGLDICQPNEAFSAALFQEYGRAVIEDQDARSTTPVVCGGTGFYIRALVDNFNFPAGEQLNNPVRAAYTAILEKQGAQTVWDILNEKDAASAQLIPVNDSKRVIRALELCAEGLHYSQQLEKFSKLEAFYSPLCMLGLYVQPDVLRNRIDLRVDVMVEAGLVEEVERLLNSGYRSAITANQAIGYKEIVAFLDGAISKDEAIAQIKQATKQYAKRQRTWFKKDKRIQWLDATHAETANLLEQAAACIAEIE